ncbi:hypothetical protein ACLK17_07795 [Escherichia coli]
MSLAILSCLEHDQVLARPGGDEFPVLASNTSQSALEAWHHEFYPVRSPFASV